MTATVGVIGIGRMGLPICGRLARAGFDVIANDVRADRAQAARQVGARWVQRTSELVSCASIVLTVLPGSRALEEAAAAVSPLLRPGMSWIDMTSAAPPVARDVVAPARARGIQCLDATIGGSVEAAVAGRLQLFVGGPAPAVERHRAVLETLGTVHHVGEHGSGYATKLIVNLLWFGQAIATAESFLLALKAGIDLAVLRDVVANSAAASEFIHGDLHAVFEGDYLPSFGLEQCCEQLDAAVSLASEHNVPFELSAAVRRAYRDALARYGPLDGELLPIALLEEQAGVLLRKTRAAKLDDPTGPA